MNVIVFGSTGGIGRESVRQALDAGHTVTAVARRPNAIEINHPRLTVVKGDAMQPDTLTAPMQGQDAVISALGIAKEGPTTLYSQGVSNIITAMRAAGVRRILCISASGLDPGPWWQRVFAKPLLWRAFNGMYSDLVRMEALVQASGLDWTVVRPPRLSDKPRTGKYQVAVNAHLKSGFTLSRADTADYMVRHLDDRATYCGVVEIAY